jgi:Creatinine amidohydrolase
VNVASRSKTTLSGMPQFMKESSLRYSMLTYRDISARAEHGTVALVPLGCTEQQGPHLAVGFDTWLRRSCASPRPLAPAMQLASTSSFYQ